jgi:hypothetical protein
MPNKGRNRLIIGAAGAALVLLAIWGFNGRAARQAADASASGAAQASSNTAGNLGSNASGQASAGSTLTPEQKAAQILQLQRQLELAQHTYNSYKASTKYPQESRPISEHPDQIYPNRPIDEEHDLHKKNGQVDASIKVKTSQSRVFVGNNESVTFSITATDKNGQPLPVFVNSAVARGLVVNGQRAQAPLTVGFADDGKAGDLAAGDGIFSATITPSNTGFANFSGTVRTEVSFNVGDSNGFVNFDFIYTPQTPATWAGSVRDVLEAGSLNFYLKANVNQGGRYLVSGRLDDANGKPFALVSFNDILATGTQEIRLQLFGKLVVDHNPAFPLTLRDVDAYLLKENTDPDRALMPRLVGAVHTSKKYPQGAFSAAEWDSEQRSRYLTEYGKDVEEAKAALNQVKQN